MARAKARKSGTSPAGAEVSSDPLLRFYSMPGFLVRRSKQKSTYMFMEHCGRFGITPIQYAVLKILEARPGSDQGEISDLTALDAATTGGVIQRLHKRGLVQRVARGRHRVTFLTKAGARILERVEPHVAESQGAILNPLNEREQRQLLRLLSKVLGVTNDHYRVPSARNRRRW